MIALLAHRGPDGEGVWRDRDAALGHRRLSILDLSDAAAQPMATADGRYVMTYNGEIYNYVELRSELEGHGEKFTSSGDTEVLLRAFSRWGKDCLSRLNGMFAFAVYDTVERALFLARDRLGVKPLVWCDNGSEFAFASEAKSLVQPGFVSGAYEPEAVYEYLARGYTSGGRSFFRGVQVLPAGHYLVVRPDTQPSTTEWWMPSREPVEGVEASEWAGQVGELVADAVRLRLRSDVPVGAHLSGGLDSSAVVAAAARAGAHQLQTFTGAFVDDEGFDERAHARSVVDLYGLVAHEREISIDELPTHFERLIWHLDEPIAGEGVFPQLLVCDLVREHGVKVVLGGQGGDELFGGYLRHRALFLRRRLSSGSMRERVVAGRELVELALAEWRRVRSTSTRVSDAELSPGFLAQVDPAFRDEVRRSRLSFASAAELMWWDLRTYLPALLHVEDRTSMAASIESRTPLLDYRLVELALRIPEELQFSRTGPKPLLRAAVREWLPPQVAARRDKRGFNVPLHRWRETPRLKALVEEVLVDDPNGGGAVFAPSLLGSLEKLAPSQLWSMLSIAGWLRATGSVTRG